MLPVRDIAQPLCTDASPDSQKPGRDSVQLAHVICHELAHAKGLRHTEMRNVRYGWADGWKEYYGWAPKYTIAVNPEPATPTIEDRRAQRHRGLSMHRQYYAGLP